MVQVGPIELSSWHVLALMGIGILIAGSEGLIDLNLHFGMVGLNLGEIAQWIFIIAIGLGLFYFGTDIMNKHT